jgi:hypothetical protein
LLVLNFWVSVSCISNTLQSTRFPYFPRVLVVWKWSRFKTGNSGKIAYPRGTGDHQIPPGGGGSSSYTFGYRRTAEIFKTPPIHIFNIFENHTHSYISIENPDPIIYFITILWPVFIHVSISIKCYLYVYVLFFFLLLWAQIGK